MKDHKDADDADEADDADAVNWRRVFEQIAVVPLPLRIQLKQGWEIIAEESDNDIILYKDGDNLLSHQVEMHWKIYWRHFRIYNSLSRCILRITLTSLPQLV